MLTGVCGDRLVVFRIPALASTLGKCALLIRSHTAICVVCIDLEYLWSIRAMLCIVLPLNHHPSCSFLYHGTRAISGFPLMYATCNSAQPSLCYDLKFAHLRGALLIAVQCPLRLFEIIISAQRSMQGFPSIIHWCARHGRKRPCYLKARSQLETSKVGCRM